MKFVTVAKSLILGLAVLMATSAFAGTKANLNLQSAITVNGTTIKPGDYTLEWEGSGPDVEVHIMQGRAVLAKLPAKVVDLGAPASNNAAVVRENADGTSTLKGARFQGKKFALEVSEPGEGMPAGSSK